MASVCRVCLSGDLRLRPVQNELVSVYDKLANSEFNCEDQRPRAVCSFCLQKLLKCYTFSKMAQRSEQIFNQLFSNGILEATQESFAELHHHVKQQWSTHMQCFTVNDNESDNLLAKEEPMKENLVEEECLDINSVSDCTLTVEEIKSELFFDESNETQDKKVYVCDNSLICKGRRIQHVENNHTINDMGHCSKEIVCNKPEIKSELFFEETDETQDKKVYVCDNSLICKEQRIQHVENNHTTYDMGHCSKEIVCNKPEIKSELFFEETDETQDKKVYVCDNSLICKGQRIQPVENNHTTNDMGHCSKEIVCNKPEIKSELFFEETDETLDKEVYVCDNSLICKGQSIQHVENNHTTYDMGHCSKEIVCNKPEIKSELFFEETDETQDKKVYVCDNSLICKGQRIQHVENNHTTYDMGHCSKEIVCKKPVDLSECSKTLIYKSKQIRSIGPGDKLFHCDECEKIFRFKCNLIRHLRKHSHFRTGEKPYVCSVCDKTFSQKHHLISHERTHTGEKPYGCFVCDKFYSRKDQLILHQRTHTGGKPYACSVCDKTFSRKQLLVYHERAHTGEKSFACYACDKTFSIKCNLIKHQKIHTGEKPFVCSVCDKAFSLKSNLKSHQKIHTGEKPFACSVCDKTFSLKHNLINHHKIHTGENPYACSVCNKSFNNKYSLIKHIRIHTGEKPFACSVCDKTFSQKQHLISHQRTHTGEMPFACSVCNKTFSRKQYLISHERTHSGEMPFACSVCNKTFSSKQYLISHERTHTGEMPFACSVCNKTFSRKQYLTYHERTHTGEKPFACSVCDKTFSTKCSLIAHQKIHTGEKPYGCFVCDKFFSRKDRLILHQRTHTGEKPYACSVCNKSFNNKYSLIKHIRIHTGEKPFACSVCDKTFSQKQHLISHERTHTGEMPFACSVCNKTFSRKPYLIYHERTHTREMPFACSVPM